MTDEQLTAVLNWKYPDIGKAYAVKNGVLVFDLWLDRASGQPSNVTKPTMAQCEAWLSNLPAPDLTPTATAEYDAQYKCIRALALVILDEINLIRGADAVTIAAMADLTEAQLRTAFINKRKTL